MPEPVGLLTSAKLQREEFVEFVSTLQIAGTQIIEQPDDQYDAQLVRGKQNVWVALDNDELKYLEEREEDTKLIQQKLGNEPQTYILLDISKYEPTSQLLAVEFAALFARRWPCVVDNLRSDDDHKIYSSQEIFELYKRGEGFWLQQ